jgi:hypothetical protein
MKTPNQILWGWERGFLDGAYRGKDIYDAYTVGMKKNESEGRIEGSGFI